MEADLDLIVPVLIKKSAESNGFICDEANKALQAMVRGVSESRATGALVACSAHRNPSCRAKAARIIESIKRGLDCERASMLLVDEVIRAGKQMKKG